MIIQNRRQDDERIIKLSFQMEQLIQHQKEVSDHLVSHEKLDFENNEKILELLNGNGSPGIRMRVDRLEQSETRRNIHIGLIWAAMLSAVGRWLIK